MDILCSKCGLDEAYYQCESCNKNFCINDWDKFHTNILHEKIRITFPINEKSREILIRFFESLKDEILLLFKFDKQHQKLFYIDDYKNVSLICTGVISYMMKITIVNKKILYTPIEYFLINSHILAEKYTKSFDWSKFQTKPYDYVTNFMFQNYLVHDSTTIYNSKGVKFMYKQAMYTLIPTIIATYIRNREYRIAFEFLENLKESLFYFNLLGYEMKVSIEALQYFITQILKQNPNIDLTYWDLAEKKIIDKKNLYDTIIFYNTFQFIFNALANRKYFLKCLKGIIKMAKPNSLLFNKIVCPIYLEIANFYRVDNNYKKCEKYMLKSLHLLEKNGNLIYLDEHNIMVTKLLLSQLVEIAKVTNKIKKLKHFTKRFNFFAKKYQPKSTDELIWSLIFYGKVCCYNGDYEAALNSFNRCLNEIKKKDSKEKHLVGCINYSLAFIYFAKNDFKSAVKKIYKAKQITEARLGDYFIYNINMNLLLAKIYLYSHRFDESLKYFNWSKESFFKLRENENSLAFSKEILEIDYNIAQIYFLKGEVIRPLRFFENYLLLLDQDMIFVENKTYAIISANYFVGLLYSQLGNLDKLKYHIEICLEIVDNNTYDLITFMSFMHYIAIGCVALKLYKKLEEICLKLLKVMPNEENKQNKLMFSMFLLSAYVNQGKYEKYYEILDYIESNLIHLNKSEDMNLKFNLLNEIGSTLAEKKDFNRAVIAFKNAENILDRYLKTWALERAQTWFNIGHAYLWMGEYKESERYLFISLDFFSNAVFNAIYIIQNCANLATLYRFTNNIPRQKYYCEMLINCCRENNIDTDLYDNHLVQLIDICKKNKDNETGIAYWYELKECIKKKNPHTDLISAIDENGNIILSVDLTTY